MNPRSVADFKDLVKMNRKGDVESVKYSADPPLPVISSPGLHRFSRCENGELEGFF